MDITTVLGLLLAFGVVGFSMASGEGGLGLFYNLPSIMIVVGGSLGVTIANFTLEDLKGVMKVFLKSVLYRSSTPQVEIDRIVEYANLARKDGLLALESRLEEVDDSFFSKGIQLVIDGFSADTVRDIMTLEAEWQRQRHSMGKKILDQLASYAPALGMIGTLVGLIQMLVSLSDPSKLGAGMAIALITTLYGALLSNMVFLPLAGKLDVRAKQEALLRELMIEGIVAVQSGEKPALIKEKLTGFIAPAQRVALAGKD
jgi:chemotaxis protein MotA